MLLIIGKSGSGKNFFVDSMGLNAIPSYTTRKKRKGEVDGIEHIFITKKLFKEKFEKKVNTKDILAYTLFDKNYYFVTLDQFNNKNYNAYIIDVDGLEKLFKNAQYVKQDINVCVIKTLWFIRLYRMIKRGDGFWKAVDRLKHDYYAFKSLTNILDEYQKTLHFHLTKILN